MHSLPPELHAIICEFAAYPPFLTSPGLSYNPSRTIRNLGLVSKYFHEVSKQYLFTTICITKGVDQALSLVKRLESIVEEEGNEETAATKIGVRWMFLCDVDIYSSQEPNNNEDAPKILSRLLALTSSTLRNLTFLSGSQSNGTSLIGRVYRIYFPLLKHLTISGYYPFPSQPFRSRSPSPTLSALPPPPVSNFPSLTSLVLHGNPNPSGLFSTHCLGDAFPSVKDITVSGVGPSKGFYTELNSALDTFYSTTSPTQNHTNERTTLERDKVRIDDDDDDIFQACFPPTLQRLTIEAIPSPIAPTYVSAGSTRPTNPSIEPDSHRIPNFMDRRDDSLNQNLSSLRKKSANLFKANNENGLYVVVKDRPAKDWGPRDFLCAWL